MEPTRRHACHVAQGGTVQPARRELLAEEPLVIQFGERPLVTLMRTPGNDAELALGYLLTEGLIPSAAAVADIAADPETTAQPRGMGVSPMRPRGVSPLEIGPGSGTEMIPQRMGETPMPPTAANVVRVTLTAASQDLQNAVPPHRRVFSSCSVCGIEQIKETVRLLPPFPARPARLSCAAVTALAEQMSQRQRYFKDTGASHAAALAPRPLDAPSLERMIVREDIGRHNALDKAVGAATAAGWDLTACALCLSSRLSFEMVAKAARAGIADVVGVSAPTTLAVDLAQRLGMFLAGFARGDNFTIYSGLDALET